MIACAATRRLRPPCQLLSFPASAIFSDCPFRPSRHPALISPHGNLFPGSPPPLTLLPALQGSKVPPVTVTRHIRAAFPPLAPLLTPISSGIPHCKRHDQHQNLQDLHYLSSNSNPVHRQQHHRSKTTSPTHHQPCTAHTARQARRAPLTHLHIARTARTGVYHHPWTSPRPLSHAAPTLHAPSLRGRGGRRSPSPTLRSAHPLTSRMRTSSWTLLRTMLAVFPATAALRQLSPPRWRL